MKAKKTLRKMAHRPLARALAKLQRDLRSMERRITRLVELAEALETENRVALGPETELRERLARAEAGAGATGQPGPGEALFEAEQADPVRNESGPQPVQLEFDGGLCVCGHTGAEHGTRGKYCCRVNCPCEGFEADRTPA